MKNIVKFAFNLPSAGIFFPLLFSNTPIYQVSLKQYLLQLWTALTIALITPTITHTLKGRIRPS